MQTAGTDAGAAWTQFKVNNGGRVGGVGVAAPNQGNSQIAGYLFLKSDNGLDGVSIAANGTGKKEIKFLTDGVQRAVVIGGGKVGIGTTNPDQTLTLDGTNSWSTVKAMAHSNHIYDGTLVLGKTRGTAAAPAAVGIGSLGKIQFWDPDGTATAGGAFIPALASQNWTAAARGAYL